MTVSELIKEIDRLPNYLYTFFAEDGFHRVILGGHSCRTQDKYTNLDSCERYFDEMQKLFEKESLTNDEKAIIAKKMKRIMSICDYRHSELHSIKEQEEYLNKLDNKSLQEISKQVLMYKTAREYYRDYVYNK